MIERFCLLRNSKKLDDVLEKVLDHTLEKQSRCYDNSSVKKVSNNLRNKVSDDVYEAQYRMTTGPAHRMAIDGDFLRNNSFDIGRQMRELHNMW